MEICQDFSLNFFLVSLIFLLNFLQHLLFYSIQSDLDQPL